MKKDKVIFWDFDGVLMDSNAVRDYGFEKVLFAYPTDEVDKLLDFHRQNGGLSRYVKFRYFFEQIRKEQISEKEVNAWAELFSIQMKKLLSDESLLIQETINFVKENYEKYPMHIVSGSDGKELNYLCEKINIHKYFLSISGSPTPKTELLNEVLSKYHYNREDCFLIGDSTNDYEAATANKIGFYGYNNPSLKIYPYLETINNLDCEK